MVSRGSALDSCFLDIIHARKVLRQIGIALVLDAALVGPAAPRRALAIFGIESIYYIHPRCDPAERCKARLVETRVVGKVDEDLAGAGIGTGRRKGDGPALVTLRDRIIADLCRAPSRHDCRIAADAELHHEPGDHAKETHIVIESILHEIVETIGSFRRPIA